MIISTKDTIVKNAWSAKILNLERKKRKEEKVILNDFFNTRYNNQECLEY